MKRTIFLLCKLSLYLSLVACGPEDKCAYEPPADDSRPDILVIGDSISLGYTPVLEALFGEDKQVIHNECNAKHSFEGVLRIDHWLDSRERFEVITFNHGIWDSLLSVSTTDSEYAENLREIGLKVMEKTDRPVFVLTTEILPGTPKFDPQRVAELNNVAELVMADLGIPVIDLYTLSTMHRDKHINPTDVHYNGEGYWIFGEYIREQVRSIYGY